MTKATLATKAPEERRALILRSTVAVVRDRGFARTRVSDIAEAAGTSQGLILYHFGSLAGALGQALTLLEDEFYEDLERSLQAQVGPRERLRLMAELGAGSGPAVGDWRLWLELWVRALHDPDARSTRESLDRRWRSALVDVITEGIATGDFATTDLHGASLRLACLMDGLAIQLALEDPEMTSLALTDQWWRAASLELNFAP